MKNELSLITLLELINDYSKVAGYKINTQKSLAFLYTNTEKTEREIKETIPFNIATKMTFYLVLVLKGLAGFHVLFFFHMVAKVMFQFQVQFQLY